VCVFLDFRSCHHQKGGDCRSKLHDESRLIQRVLMITKMMTKSSKSRTPHDNKDDDLKNQRMSSRLNQEHFKVQKEIWFQESRIKFQDSSSKNPDQDSRLKILESREDSIKISIKKFFQKLSSTWTFLKNILPKSKNSLVIDYQIVVIYYQ